MGPLIPLFWTFGDVYPGFQSQSGSPVCFLTFVILRFTSGVTPADCIEVSMAAKPFWSTYLNTDMSVSIAGGSGLKSMMVHAACSKHDTVHHSATLARLPDSRIKYDPDLCRKGWESISLRVCGWEQSSSSGKSCRLPCRLPSLENPCIFWGKKEIDLYSKQRSGKDNFRSFTYEFSRITQSWQYCHFCIGLKCI